MVRSPTIACPMEDTPIVFGTDGWRGRIARDLTFDSVRRVVTAAAAWTIDEANVELVWDPPWNQSMMTEAAKLQLGLL